MLGNRRRESPCRIEPERHEDRRVCPLIARGWKDDGGLVCYGPVLVEGRPIVIPRTLFTDLVDDPPLEVVIDLQQAEVRGACQPCGSDDEVDAVGHALDHVFAGLDDTDRVESFQRGLSDVSVLPRPGTAKVRGRDTLYELSCAELVYPR